MTGFLPLFISPFPNSRQFYALNTPKNQPLTKSYATPVAFSLICVFLVKNRTLSAKNCIFYEIFHKMFVYMNKK